jgi:hypothetical protein
MASFQGKKNIYLCENCGHGFVTLDVDEGVTPFGTACLNKACGKIAHSLFYRCPQEMLRSISPALEWYRPDSLQGLSAWTCEHVEKGGLISRVPGESA